MLSLCRNAKWSNFTPLLDIIKACTCESLKHLAKKLVGVMSHQEGIVLRRRDKMGIKILA